MVKVSNDSLQPNPFTTYRDPNTGHWIVVKAAHVCKQHDSFDREENLKSYNNELLLAQAGRVQS
jgi:hypothetical protein